MGKVIANAMGRKRPGFDCGAEIFIAAGTAMYEALAASTERINRFEISSVTHWLTKATAQPFTKGMINANRNGNHPNEKNDFNFLPLVIPMSNKKMAKKPLNKSLVKGLMPSACFALAM